MASLLLALSLAVVVLDLPWPLELFEHFLPQYLLVGLLITLGLAMQRRRRFALVALASVAVNGAALAPWGSAPQAVAASGLPASRLSVLSINVNANNQDPTALLALIRERRPQLVFVLELTPGMARRLAPLADDYPVQIKAPREDGFGIGLYSRIPLERYWVDAADDWGFPFIQVDLRLEDKPMRVIATHPPPPMSPEQYRIRQLHFDQLARIARGVSRPIVLVGDFNTTPWSSASLQLEQASGLVNTRRGQGLLPSWPSPLAPLGIPIDQALVSPGVRIEAVRMLASVGSDHLPLLVDLSL